MPVLIESTYASLPPPQQRREEFERHIREQEEELIQQANELKERKQRLTEEEEEEVRKQASMPSLSLFNYTPSYFVPTASSSNPDLSGGDADLEEGAQHGAGSDGSVGMLSPVPGSTSWESDLSEIELVKGAEGLGFSLLDFAVSVG